VTENINSVLEAIHVALYGSLHSDVLTFKHIRQPRLSDHPTPARVARADPPPPGEGDGASGAR
jgi:hypothetical protein